MGVIYGYFHFSFQPQHQNVVRGYFRRSKMCIRDSSMGVEEIGAEGEAFDPNYHNAVMQSDCASGQKPGEIAEVLIKGYKPVSYTHLNESENPSSRFAAAFVRYIIRIFQENTACSFWDQNSFCFLKSNQTLREF